MTALSLFWRWGLSRAAGTGYALSTTPKVPLWVSPFLVVSFPFKTVVLDLLAPLIYGRLFTHILLLVIFLTLPVFFST